MCEGIVKKSALVSLTSFQWLPARCISSSGLDRQRCVLFTLFSGELVLWNGSQASQVESCAICREARTHFCRLVVAGSKVVMGASKS